MALLAAIARDIAELVRAGYPEETARRIATGELPMDTASRMERARQQGFDTENVAFHGTRADIGEFIPSERGKMGPGVYTSPNPSIASRFALPGNRANMADPLADREVLNEELLVNQGANVLPLLLRGNRMERFEALRQNPDIPMLALSEPTATGSNLLAESLKERGVTGLEMLATGTGGMRGPVTEQNTFDPNDVRSLYSAAFDPEYTGPNILGFQGGSQRPSLLDAAASSAVGAASMASDSPEEKLYEGLTDKMVDYLTDQMGGSKEDRQRAELISMGMDFLPFIGAAKGVSETFDAYKNDDTLGMALGAAGTAAGLIPFGRSAFKGVLGMVEDAPQVTRDTALLQRVGDPESVNTMKLEVEPGVELLPSRRISAADLEDRGFVSGMADTSRGDLSRVVAVNDQPVDMVRFGGQDYMRQPYNAERGILWASDEGAITGLTNAAKAASEISGGRREPLYIPYQMGGASTDFATMTADIMVPIAKQNLNKTKKRALDKRIREGAGNKKNEFKPQPDWPGIDSPKAAEWLANAGGDRKAVTKAIDEFRDDAGINLSQARAAIVDAEQMTPRVGNLRQAGILDLTKAPEAGRHPSYNTDLMGTYLGQFGEGANVLDDLNPLIRSSRTPFVPEMISRGHDLSGATIPAPVGKAMQPGLIGMFDQATIDELIRKGVITP